MDAPDESTLVARLEAAGPVPQADVFEPWDDGDPWRARVVLADLDALEARLAVGGIEPGVEPGLSEWTDRGRVGEEVLEADGLTATCRFDLEDGELRIPDLVREGPAPDGLTADLLAALGSRGDPDRVTSVHHRTTGRPGVLVEVAVSDREPLDERRAVIDGVASVARGAVPLAPDASWWFDAGRVSVVAWRIAPCRPGLPADAPLTGTVHAHAGLVELQVALPPDAHDLHARILGESLGALGWVGSRARWGLLDGRPVFLACWEGPGEDASRARAAAADWPCRVVPGCPEGLEPHWVGVDPAWYPAGDRTLVRWRCGLRDRDLLPVCAPRDGDAFDRELASTLAPLGPCEPVQAGLAAIRLVLPALPASAWSTVVRVLGELPEPAIGPVIPVAMRDRVTVLLPRLDLPAAPEPPAFSAG